MKQISDEMLMAYADGELSSEDQRKVQDVLPQNPEARRLVKLFSWTRLISRRAFGDVEVCGVSAQHLSRLWPQSNRHTEHIKSYAGLRLLNLIIPAFVILVLVGSLVVDNDSMLRSSPSDPTLALGNVDNSEQLGVLLNDVSGTGKKQMDSYTLSAKLQFTDKFGRACQQINVYRAYFNKVPARMLIACRNKTSSWSVIGVISTQSTVGDTELAYVTNDKRAQKALSSMLEMVGAERRVISDGQDEIQ